MPAIADGTMECEREHQSDESEGDEFDDDHLAEDFLDQGAMSGEDDFGDDHLVQRNMPMSTVD